MKRVSDRQRKRLAEYSKLKREYLKQHPFCEVYPDRRSEDIHHLRGRTGRLLCDTRYWCAVSRAGHVWIHNNIQWARDNGWLCEKGKWGRSEP